MYSNLESELIPLGLNSEIKVSRTREQELAASIHRLACEVGVLIENCECLAAVERCLKLRDATDLLVSRLKR